MTALGDLVLETQSGFACGKEDPDGVFQFRMHNVSKESALVLDKRRRVPRDAHKKLDHFLVRERDVLFNATNSPDGVGKSILIPALDEPAVFSNHFLRLRPDPNRLDAAYLWRWLQYRFQMGVFSVMARQWVNQATVDRSRLLSLPIAHPSLAEQRRIAAILDQADALRTKRRQTLAHLDDLTQSIFHAMFGDALRNERGLPQVTLGSVAEVVTGKSPSRADQENFGDAIEWIKTDNLGGDIATTAAEGLSEQGSSRSRVAPAGSVLVACIAGSRSSIGKASTVDRAVAFNQQINAVLPSAELDSNYLLGQLKAAPELVRRESTGGMKGLVTKSAFQSIEILLPGISHQREFAARVEQVNGQRTIVEHALDADDELFASLQSRAFSGGL